MFNLVENNIRVQKKKDAIGMNYVKKEKNIL